MDYRVQAGGTIIMKKGFKWQESDELKVFGGLFNVHCIRNKNAQVANSVTYFLISFCIKGLKD